MRAVKKYFFFMKFISFYIFNLFQFNSILNWILFIRTFVVISVVNFHITNLNIQKFVLKGEIF